MIENTFITKHGGCFWIINGFVKEVILNTNIEDKLIYTNDGLVVTNTYPVFIKTRYESQNGNCLSSEIDIKKSDYKNTNDYLSDYNNRLNITIKNVYETNRFAYAEKCEDGSEFFIYIINEKFAVYLLKTKSYLVFMDFDIIDERKFSVTPIPLSSDVPYDKTGLTSIYKLLKEKNIQAYYIYSKKRYDIWEKKKDYKLAMETLSIDIDTA